MRLQTSSAGLAIGDADNRYLRLAGGTLTGELSALAGLNTTRPYSSGLVPQDSSNPLPAFPFVTEWNNAGKNWTAVRVSVTNTASGAGSKLQDWQVGGVSKASIDTAGSLTLAGQLIIGSAALSFNGSELGLLHNFVISGNLAVYGASAKITIGPYPYTAGIGYSENGVIEFNNGTIGTLRDWKARRGSLSEYLDITEMSAPAAPAANTARLYVEDNGSGKTRLMVLFPTGAAQVLATEP